MLILVLAVLLIAAAFGVGAALHFLWLGLIVLVILALIGLVARRA
jgi:hypothetical protein